jgi:hypothetical protein
MHTRAESHTCRIRNAQDQHTHKITHGHAHNQGRTVSSPALAPVAYSGHTGEHTHEDGKNVSHNSCTQLHTRADTCAQTHDLTHTFAREA